MSAPVSGDGNTSSTTDGNDGGTTSTAGDEFKPITTQDDLNKVIGDRLERERAKYADYKDVKAKAAQLDSLAEASKTAEEKFNERIAALEAAHQAATTQAARFKVASAFGISNEDADLFLTGSDEETLTAQAKRLSERIADRKKQGNHVPREGTHPKAPASDERAFVRDLFGTGG